MNKYFKSLLVGVVVFVSAVLPVKAVDATTTIATATISSIQQTPIHLTSLEVINNAAATMSVWFYDAPTNVLTQVNGAYTNYSTYTTNIVITTTNYQGVVETSTNLATYTLPLAVAQATNAYRIIKAFTVAAGGTASWNPSGGVYLNYGLASTNTQTNMTVNYIYSNIR